MVGTDIQKTDKVWCAVAYFPFLSLFIYLWGKAEYHRFHAYQGIALLAYAVVGLLISDIIRDVAGLRPFPVLLAVGGIYFAIVLIAGTLVLSGKKIDMKIYKSLNSSRVERR
ncbi:MAG: hypothetical protein GY771_03075 [bacterium]|nr:hypothetical protein [bacterium]